MIAVYAAIVIILVGESLITGSLSHGSMDAVAVHNYSIGF